MQEKLIQIENGNSNTDFIPESVDRTIAVNDMYIDAIQAKLKILDQI